MTAPVTPRRTVLAAGLATLFGGALAGCGTAGVKSGGSAGGDVASAWIIDSVTEQAFTDSFIAWGDDHPDRKIAVQSFANEPYKQRIRNAVDSGRAPTLVYNWGGGTLASYVRAHRVEDLTDLAADPEVRSRFLPAIAEGGKIDGRTYALPNNGIKPVMIYYNKDLFEKIGAQPPTAWSDLMALVPEFRQAGIAPFSVAGKAKWPLLPWLAYLMDRIGGTGVMDDILAGRARAWSHPAVTDANEKIRALVDAGGFVEDFASLTADSGADAALLYTGRAAMTLGLPAAYQTIQQSDPKFVADGRLGYVPFPTVDGGDGHPRNVVGNPSNYWSISADASDAQKEVAHAYLRSELLSDRYVDDLLKAGYVPPVVGVDRKLAHSGDPAYLTAVYEMSAQAPHFALAMDQALDPRAGDAVLTNLHQIFLKQITPKEFAAHMNATLRH